jgi:Carboxypeptidase regulatory-like domain/TonB dependent receptor
VSKPSKIGFPSFSAIVILLSLEMASPWARGQSLYGGISGSVRDSTGEPFAKATITATSEAKGIQLRTKTDAQGHYSFHQVQPDTYDVRLDAMGRTVTYQDIAVSADEESTVDLKLPAQGQVSQMQAASTLKTRADVSITLDRNAIVNLPNFDQNSTRFGYLAPSTQLRGTGAISAQDPQNSLQLSIDGQLPAGTAVLLDGTDNRDSVNQLSVINPPLESLAEIRIVTESFDAETGQALSGVVMAQTRSGTNAWHGSALEFRRSSWAEAGYPDIQNPSLAGAPTFKVNLFGGSLGGPIRKNKLFIFGDYQGTRRSLGSTQVLNVPSDLVRSTCLNPAVPYCDLSEYLPVSSSSSTPSPKIYDPLTTMSATKGSTATVFPAIPGCGEGQGSASEGKAGYCIPRTGSSGHSGLSPQAIYLLSLLPPANLPGAVSNYQVSGAQAWDDDDYTIRADNDVTAKLQLFGRYTYAQYRISSPGAFGNLAGGPGFGPDGFAGYERSPNHSLAAGFDYAISPGLNTDFRFGFFRRQLTVLPNSYNTDPATNAGILGLNSGDALSSGMPSLAIQQPSLQTTSSAITYGDGAAINQCNCPLFETLQQFQWVNNWVRARGKHVWKWGEDFRLAEDHSVVSATHRSGAFTFAPKDTSNPAASGPSAGGLGLATFLIGDVSTFNRTTGSAPGDGTHQKRLFFYGQDEWRATSRFTVTYGLRWEIYFPETVAGKGDGAFLNLNTGMIGLAGYSCCNQAGNVHRDWDNFAPRVGVAYRVNRSSVVRVAYGRNFDAGVVLDRSPTLNPPLVVTQSLPQPLSAPYNVFNFGAPGTNPLLPPVVSPLPTLSASGQFLLPNNVVATALPTRVRVPTLDQWNLAVQHELAPGLSFELAYIGNQATHVLASASNGGGTNVNLNQPTIAGTIACQQGAKSQDCLNSYPFNAFGWTQTINLAGGVASANYNALEAKLVKRFSKGYEFNANYTWAKGIGYQADYFDHDPALNRGVNIFDRTHTFNFYNVLDLPFGRGRSMFADVGRAANYFLGGWSVNTVTTWASGLPFSPTYAPSECSADRDTGPCRPDIVGPVHITGDRNNYFTTTGGLPLEACPTKGCTGPGQTIGPWQRPAIATFGTAGYNSLRGPRFFDTDLAVEKSIPLTERYSLQFRTDFLNVFNKVNLGDPSGCVDCSANNAQTGAVITSLAANAVQRQIEFALRLQF